jgi:hemerythrin superfamily protein
MDPTKMLEADHREAEQLFDQIEKAEGAERKQLVEKLTTALRSHMELEEQVLYPKMKPITGEEDYEEANTEHALARKMIDELLALSPDEPGVDGALESLKAGILHHVEEEEGDIFKKLRSEGEQILQEIATPFMQKRMELGMEMNPSAIASAFSKEELVEEAKSAGVENATSMKKEEIAEALAQRMAS